VTGRSLQGLAVAAYVFGYPLVSHLTEVCSQTTEPLVPFAAPVNLFGHATALSGLHDFVGTGNTDTLCSVAHCDVSIEPLVLRVPDSDDRSFVMQCVDAWTTTFASIVRPATGPQDGAFLFAPAAWNGLVPDGMTRITTPHTMFTINARYAISGPDDLLAVARLQQQTWVAPLSRYPELPQTAWRTFGDRNIAPFNEIVAEELRFWEQLRAWMALFPPPDADRLLVRSFLPLGLLGGPDTYLHADADLVAILSEAAHIGQANVEALATAGAAGHGGHEARWIGAAPMTPQQALGLLRAHLEDIKNACGVYGVVAPYVLECGDEMLALDKAIAILTAVVKKTEGIRAS
jgi:hypothetical protein